MPRLFDRIASARGVVAQSADWIAGRVLPAVAVEAACNGSWRCTESPCGLFPWHYECIFCDGHWTGQCRCNVRC